MCYMMKVMNLCELQMKQILFVVAVFDFVDYWPNPGDFGSM